MSNTWIEKKHNVGENIREKIITFEIIGSDIKRDEDKTKQMQNFLQSNKYILHNQDRLEKVRITTRLRATRRLRSNSARSPLSRDSLIWMAERGWLPNGIPQKKHAGRRAVAQGAFRPAPL